VSINAPDYSSQPHIQAALERQANMATVKPGPHDKVVSEHPPGWLNDLDDLPF